MLDQRLEALLRAVEELPADEQQELADHIQEWLDDLAWKRVLNEPGHDALYEAAAEEMRRGETLPLRAEDFEDPA